MPPKREKIGQAMLLVNLSAECALLVCISLQSVCAKEGGCEVVLEGGMSFECVCTLLGGTCLCSPFILGSCACMCWLRLYQLLSWMKDVHSTGVL